MSNPDDQEVRDETDRYNLYFIIAGVSVGFATFLQVSQQSAIVMKDIRVCNQARHIDILYCYQFQSYRIKYNGEPVSIEYSLIVFQFRSVVYRVQSVASVYIGYPESKF
jgi:hypothetical protein